jgi:ribonuclease P protein component
MHVVPKAVNAWQCKAARLNSARISELLKTNPKTSKNWGLYLGSRSQGMDGALGITVAKKLAKRAVDRNKLKRFIRESTRQPHSTILETHDIVVRLKKPVGQTTRGRLRSMEFCALKEQLVELI